VVAPVTAPIGVVVLDDHEMVAAGMSALAATSDPPAVVRSAGPAPAAARAAAQPGDVVLLDIDLGPAAPPIAELVEAFTDVGCHVLLVSAVGDSSRIKAAVFAGALGYVPKRAAPAVLAEAMVTVARGETYLTADLAAVLAAPADRPDLSQQEMTAVRLYASGLTTEAVGRRMNVTQSTVKEYLDRVRAKYAAVGRAARTRTQLANEAMRDGFVDPPA
jgi:DNA-binding NarL/FixJ family response regulator